MIRKFGAVTGLTNQPQGLDTGAGINTGDATATAADIANGLTAYGPLGKITGTGANAKLHAAGIVTSSSGNSAFTQNTGATLNMRTVTVSGLNFPNGIKFIVLKNMAVLGDSTKYDSSKMSDVATNAFIEIAISTTQMYYAQLISPAVVGATSFSLPVFTASTNYTYEVWGN